MTIITAPSLPSNARLLKATVLSIVVAGALLVTTVLPAEFGIDPTGIGGMLGLDTLAATAEAHEPPSTAAQPAAATSADMQARNAAEAAKAAAAFGTSDKQRFSAESVSWAAALAAPKHGSMSVTLAPGKGAEVKTLLKAGDGVVFHWTADGDVAVDMHGERLGVQGEWTSYAVEPAQRSAYGTFIAPFDGSHGWYWENRGTTPVTVRVDVTGFQEALYQP